MSLSFPTIVFGTFGSPSVLHACGGSKFIFVTEQKKDAGSYVLVEPWFLLVDEVAFFSGVGENETPKPSTRGADR
jgi:hypothetical protein